MWLMPKTRRYISTTWVAYDSSPWRRVVDIWGIDFVGPFVSLYGKKYILVIIDYVSKWVKAMVIPDNEGKNVTTFLKRNIFSRHGTLWEIISDGGSHFYNKVFTVLLEKYRVKQHK